MKKHQVDSDPAIRVEEVTIAFGRKTVLRNVSLEVETGSVYALLGRNGEGKTTLVRALLGQIRAKAGSIEVLGFDPWSERQALMEAIGYVPEVPDIPPEATPAEAFKFCSSLHRRWNEELAHSRLEHFGLEAKRQFSTFSRGQKAQLQLILALASEPQILILDDPTLGLDALTRRELYEEVIRELADRGTTVFVTTHDLDGVEHLADRVGIVAEGTMLFDSKLEDLKQEWAVRLGGSPDLEEIFVQALSGGGAA